MNQIKKITPKDVKHSNQATAVYRSATIQQQTKCVTFEQVPGAISYLIEKVNYLESLLEAAPPNHETRDRRYITSISGLAKLLTCSIPTAQKLKNSGVIPFKQFNRKVIFDPVDVLAAIEKNKHKNS